MKIIKIFSKYIIIGFFSVLVLFASNVFAQWRFEWNGDIFDPGSDNSVVKTTIWNMAYDTKEFYWARSAGKFIVDFLVRFVVPILLIVAVLVAIFGFYKLMLSSKDWDQIKWLDYIIWWVIGIIVIQSASFIASNYADLIINLKVSSQLNTLPEAIYNSIVFPFLQMTIYIVLWILFVTLLINVIKFITSADEKVVANSKNIIINNIIGIIVIMLAKEVVQFVYGKQEALKISTNNLWNIGTSLLSLDNVKVVYNIINRALSIISFVILVIIIYQSYLLLLNPTDDKQIWVIKKNFLYIFIGLVLIWFCYLIVNILFIS